jgi:thiaminase/transcriptional activator TenA
MSYGATFPLWRAAADLHWSAYTRHGFVAGLADGTVPRPAYLRYLQQDYLFLIQFARAWALATTKAETLVEMRACAATVQALIGTEIQLHVQTCAAEGISEAELFTAEEALETIAYTRFVLDSGYSGDLLDLLAALAPCVLGYGEIGARLGTETGDTVYQDWITSYAGSAYQDTCHAVGALIDGVVARRLGPDPEASPRWPDLCVRFATATRLELGFWQMGLTG